MPEAKDTPSPEADGEREAFEAWWRDVYMRSKPPLPSCAEAAWLERARREREARDAEVGRLKADAAEYIRLIDPKLEELAAENERLRAALEYVWPLIDLYGAPNGSMNFTLRHWRELYDLARAALSPKEAP